VEELGHGAVGFGDDAQTDFASVFEWQDHVHSAHGGDFFEKLAGASARPLPRIHISRAKKQTRRWASTLSVF
jgi:hypothetical protein